MCLSAADLPGSRPPTTLPSAAPLHHPRIAHASGRSHSGTETNGRLHAGSRADSFLSAKPAALGADSETRSVRTSHRLQRLPARHLHPGKPGRTVPSPAGPDDDGAPDKYAAWSTAVLSLGDQGSHGNGYDAAARAEAHDRRSPTSSPTTYGREAVDYLAEPLLSGIYGGDPAQLSVAGVLPRFLEMAAKYGSRWCAESSRDAMARLGSSVVPNAKGRPGNARRCSGRAGKGLPRGCGSDRAFGQRVPGFV